MSGYFLLGGVVTDYRKSGLLVLIGLTLTAIAYVGALRTAVADDAVQAWVWTASLPAGQAVSKENVRPVRVLRRDLLPGLAVEPDKWQGMVTAVAVQKGEAVTAHDVQPAAPVPPGWVHYVLAVTQSVVFDPAIIPGDHVSVLVSEQLPGGQTGATRIAAGALFLRLQTAEAGRTQLLRLALPPEAAEKLLTAEAAGRQVRILRAAGGTAP